MNELILKCNSTDGVVRLSQRLYLEGKKTYVFGIVFVLAHEQPIASEGCFFVPRHSFRPTTDQKSLFLPPQHMLLMAFITRKRKKGRWVAFNIVQRTLQRCVLPCFASSTQLQLITYNGSQGKKAEVCKAFLKWYFTQFLSRFFLHYRNEGKKALRWVQFSRIL